MFGDASFTVEPVTVQTDGTVWIGGNGANDGHILKFTTDGKFIKQFGFMYANAGSTDPWAFKQVAKIFLDEPAKEAYVADGYGNHRVAVIDMETGKMKRMWGAYGKTTQKMKIFTKDSVVPTNYVQTAKDETILENYSGKLTAEVNSKTRASFTYFRGNKEKFGRGASATRPDETTYNQTGPSEMYKGEVNWTASNSLYLTARYAYFKNGFSLTPRGGTDGSVMTYQDANGVFHNTFYFYSTDRPQQTVSADGNYFKGNNEFKFGFSYRKATVTSFSGLPGGGIMYANGYPNYLGYIYRDYNPATEGKYISGYASDTFTHDRFTLNIGARWDYQTSSLLPSTVNANPIAPNLLPALTEIAQKDAISKIKTGDVIVGLTTPLSVTRIVPVK